MPAVTPDTYSFQSQYAGELAALFHTMTRRLYPRTMEQIMMWADELWRHHGLYSQAIHRAVRYYMTKTEIFGAEIDWKTRENYQKTLDENFDLLGEAAQVGDDYIGWGNSFTSTYFPFRRSLRCPQCGTSRDLEKIHGQYTFNKGSATFSGTCFGKKCRKSVTFEVVDKLRQDDSLRIRVNRWPPQLVRLKKHVMSAKTTIRVNVRDYRWLADPILQGDTMSLEDTPLEIMEAVCRNKPFEFSEERVFHMTGEVAASEMPIVKGWGLPLFMSEFETAMMLVILDRYNEIILSDYLVPFRVISPPATAAGSAMVNNMDNMLMMSMQEFNESVQSLLAQHRRNPTGWNSFPFPLSYQILGGEAKNLTPVEMMEHMEQRLLSSMGIPTEFYQTSLQANAGPLIGFKMFERVWQHFASELNRWLTWLVRQQAELLNWNTVSVRLVPVSIYEDEKDKQLKVDLVGAGKLPESVLYEMLGFGIRDVFRRRIEEQQMQDEMLADAQKKAQAGQENSQAIMTMSPGGQVLQQQQAAQQQQQGGAPGQPPAQGMGGQQVPAAGGMAVGPNGATLDDLMNQAEGMAQQLLTADPLTRRRQLGTLKAQNITLYNQTKGVLAQMEQKAQTQGVQMVRSGQAPAPQ